VIRSPAIVLALGGLLLVSDAQADDLGRLEVGGYVGLYRPSTYHELYDAYNTTYARLNTGPSLGARVSFAPLRFFAAESGLSMVPTSVPDAGGTLLWAWRVAGRLNSPVEIGFLPDALDPHLVAGTGLLGVSSSNDKVGRDYDWAFHWGPGFRWALTDRLALRFDLHHYLTARINVVDKPSNHFEVLGAVSYAILKGKERAPDRDKDRIADADDACPDRPGTHISGCPLGSTVLRVVDPAGKPIAGAVVVSDADGSELGTTGDDGRFRLGDLPVHEQVGVSLSHPSGAYDGASLALDLAEDPEERIQSLDWVPKPIAVSVTDEAGAPLDAAMTVQGPEDLGPMQVGGDGKEVVELLPGEWQFLFELDGYGPQRRPLDVPVVAEGDLTVEAVMGAIVVEVTREEVVSLEKIHFEHDSAVIRGDSLDLIEAIAATLLVHEELAKIEIHGHTSQVGAADYNLNLSQRRAESVVAALVERGVDVSRLVPKGFGETQPLVEEVSPATQETNRRVEFVVVE